MKKLMSNCLLQSQTRMTVPNVTSRPDVIHDVTMLSRTQRQPQKNNRISLLRDAAIFVTCDVSIFMYENYFASPPLPLLVDRDLEELH